MGTLYECLREARLDQFYPAFRANGITRSEALINLGMPEFFALGITSSEDKRRLVELVNIIRSVHTSSLSGSPSPQRRGSGPRHSSNSGSTNSVRDNSPSSSRGSYQSRKNNVRQNNRGNATREIPGTLHQHLEPSRDVMVQDRVPAYSVASYMEMLRQASESSESDVAGEHSQSDDDQTIQRSAQSPGSTRLSSRSSAVERIKHPKGSTYNYGVHKVAVPVKSRAARSGSHRGSGEEKIKVCVRKRPLTRREIRSKEEDIVLIESTNTLIVNEPKLAVDLKAYTLQHEFVFDEVFDEMCSNEDVYIRAARPLISCIFSGGTATCFAYGQTGAGKTHTMLGDGNTPGLYLLAGQDIFQLIQAGTYGKGLHVWVSFFEIYCGQLFDLLNKRNRLHAREDGSRQVCIAGLTETEATSVTSLVQILEYGNSVRSKGSTGVNPDSSRSHAVLQLDIRSSEDIKIGKMSFIDLAGSERASDVTDTDKQTRMEGAEINQSLLALKECIRSIDQDSRHTPFRQSKLTHILKDSFVGNSQTCMIANISPTQTACEHTLNTLRYADRVKELKRDSTKSSSVGHAMNLLMNIPPAAPSNFHPSNILSSSTPMRASANPRRDRPNIPSDFVLDPAETPIRGHNLQKKQKELPRHRQEQAYPNMSVLLSRVQQLSVITSEHKLPQGTTSRSSAYATAASHGSAAPPPDASPSESEQTDTDSCNVAHPIYTPVGTSARHAPVMKSTDTEFDFPTSDFNNIDDINDLNRSGTQTGESRVSRQKESHQRLADDQAAAAAEVVVSATGGSDRRVPTLRPVIYRSIDHDTEVAHPGLAYPSAVAQRFQSSDGVVQRFQSSDGVTQRIQSSDGVAQRIQSSDGVSQRFQSSNGVNQRFTSSDVVTQRFQSSNVASQQVSRHTPILKKAHSKDVDTSDESVNEDLLYEGPIVPQMMNNLATPTTVLATHPTSFVNKHLIIPVPVDNDDLSVASQTTSGKPTELFITVGINDLSMKAGNIHLSQHSADSSTPFDDSQHRSQSVYPKVTSPSGSRSPSTRDARIPHQDTSDPAPPPSVPPPPHPPRQLPQPRRTGSPQRHHRSNEDLARSSPAHCHSDGSDSGSHRKASPSPPGEVSGDSLENIRAALSDQGPGGYRIHKFSLQKERSDPMLALDMQRKKQTLPDPHSIAKMLVRSNTPKSGRLSRDAGWKAVHSDPPLLPANTESTGGDSHSEPGSLASADFDGQEENLEHLSDGNSNTSSAVRDRKRVLAVMRSTRSKQLPQVPAVRADTDIQPFVQHSDISQRKLESPLFDLKASAKNNSAIVTEKLSSGAVFSPIHPQPVTVAGVVSVAEPAGSSSILQPTPVTVAPASDLTPPAGSHSQEAVTPDNFEAKMYLVAAHEDQLATITSLCKYEMRLLLGAKKVMGKKGFDDYLRRVSDILQQKMTAIGTLLEQISTYRSSHNQNNSAMLTTSASSMSESSSSINIPTNYPQK